MSRFTTTYTKLRTKPQARFEKLCNESGFKIKGYSSNKEYLEYLIEKDGVEITYKLWCVDNLEKRGDTCFALMKFHHYLAK